MITISIILQSFSSPLQEQVQAQDEMSKVTKNLLKAVVKIAVALSNKDNIIGTGFLVSKEAIINGQPSRKFFLVTNKHILGDWNPADGNILNYYNGIDIFFYRTNDPSGLSYKSARIDLTDESGKLKAHKVRVHPNPKVDIAIIALEEELSASNNIDLVSFDRSYILNFDKITSWFVGVGDQVFAMGYPLGITSLKNNYPIAKAGYLASLPGEELIIEFPGKNRNQEKVTVRIQGKILLIDGLIVPGNSGGPVVLASELKIRRDPKTYELQFASESTKNYIIGIVSSFLGPSGLSIAYSSDYILELIDIYLNDIIKLQK